MVIGLVRLVLDFSWILSGPSARSETILGAESLWCHLYEWTTVPLVHADICDRRGIRYGICESHYGHCLILVSCPL